MIGDAKTIIKVEADTSQAQREIRKLSETEAKAAADRAQHMKTGASQLTDHINRYGGMAVSVAAFGKIAEWEMENVKLATERARLTAAAYGIDMEQLRKASQGLATDTQLLERATRLNAGTVKFTSGELATMEGAIRGLTLRGIEQEKATEAISKAYMGQLGPLKELGLGMGDVNKLADEAGKKGLLAGEGLATAAVQAKNAWEQFRVELGTSVNLLEVLETGRANMLRRGQLGRDGLFDADYLMRIAEGYDEDKVGAAVDAMDRLTAVSNQALRDTQILKDRQSNFMQSMLGGAAGGSASGSRSGGAGSWSPSMPSYTLGPDVYGTGGASLGQAAELSASITELRGSFSGEGTGLEGVSVLEQTLGPKEEFDVYKELFADLTESIQGAYSGLVDGAMSGEQALKGILKATLKGMGSRMLGRSIEELAEGWAALGNPFTAPLAPMHFKSAALFAGGAALTGVLASQIGSGGGGGGGSSGAGAGSPGGGVPAYSGGSSGGNSGGNHTTIVYGGPDFHGSSDRQRQLAARRIVNAALVAGENDGVNFR